MVAAAARAERQNITKRLAIAGEFRAYQDVDVHAKVAGYIRAIYVDVGTHVNAGQLLAVLEIPELAAQLDGAEASVRAAQDQIGRAEGELERAQGHTRTPPALGSRCFSRSRSLPPHSLQLADSSAWTVVHPE